jgi:hypothetical protein
MSKFTYDRIGQYGHEVVAHIEKNNGVLKATDGNDYTIDTSPQSAYAKKNGFKDQVENEKFTELEVWLRKNQFEVLSPHTRANKYWELGWTEIEKSVFSSPGIKISTQQQEKISLLIFKYVLGSSTKDWKSFDEMFHDKNSEVKKIFPELPKLPTWMEHFRLQFTQIKGVTDLPNNNFDVYLYDEPGNFMDYISDLVTKDLNLYTKKDSWDPADIWLIKSSTQQNYVKTLNTVKSDLDKGDKGKYAKDKYLSIKDINTILRNAFDKNHIVGISLKKTDGKNLQYTKFNLEAKESEQDLPDIVFNRIALDCSYSADTYTFNSKTSYVYVDDNGGKTQRGAYKLAYKSNTGKGVGNITYEFLPDGKASAFLGKVPKDQLKQWLENKITPLNRELTTQKLDKLPTSHVYMPQGVLLPTMWTKEDETKWAIKVADIKKNFVTNVRGIDDFVENLKESYTYGGLSEKNASMMQMVDFTWILAKLKEEKYTNPRDKSGTDKLTEFLTLCYYFAQKKGLVYNFGPFGKLY